MTDVNIEGLSPPWGHHSVPPDDTVTVKVGPLTLWARRRADEIWLAHASGDWIQRVTPPERVIPPDDEKWIRWPVSDETDGIVLLPVFPPRPVVVHPELSFRLLPRTQARIFVRVPLWLRVEATAEDRRKLTEIPSVTLSDTWWGEFTEGELSYWLPTTARRRVSPELFQPHLVVCPLRLVNRSEEELPVEKIAFRVAHLSVFSDEGRFWADETRVRYRGKDEESRIDMSGKPPPEAAEAALVGAPRKPVPRGFRAKSIARLKSIPGLGGL